MSLLSLRSTFEGQEDVKVIVDRRYGEWRTMAQPVELERCHADRRGPQEGARGSITFSLDLRSYVK